MDEVEGQCMTMHEIPAIQVESTTTANPAVRFSHQPAGTEPLKLVDPPIVNDPTVVVNKTTPPSQWRKHKKAHPYPVHNQFFLLELFVNEAFLSRYLMHSFIVVS
jgi:hypothetical protein